MSDKQCALLNECVSDKVKDKRRTRVIACNGPGCNKTFHAACIGFDSKTDAEIKDLFFLCTRCDEYLRHTTNCIAGKLFDKLSPLIKRIEVIEATLASNTVNLCHDVVLTNDSDDSNNHGVNNVDHDVNDDRASNIVIETIADKPVIVTRMSQEASHNTCEPLYLCGVETNLSTDDVAFILNDDGVITDGIVFEKPEGSFKRKRFFVASSSNPRSLFYLKQTFIHSKLNGTWFLCDKAPKPRHLQDTNVIGSDKITTKRSPAGSHDTILPKYPSSKTGGFNVTRGQKVPMETRKFHQTNYNSNQEASVTNNTTAPNTRISSNTGRPLYSNIARHDNRNSHSNSKNEFFQNHIPPDMKYLLDTFKMMKEIFQTN